MKHICILLMAVAFMAACEKKETTVTNPPGENKTESNTTVIDKSSPAESKTESNTTINTGSSPGTSTTTTTSSSPSP